MENATEALYIAAAVLIFVLALSICINAFGNVRTTSQAILDMRDREYDFTYLDEGNNTSRTVSGADIVPSIYKAYKENYKIVFNWNEDDYLYEKNNDKINYIDLQKETLSEEDKEKFIMALLYGNKTNNWNDITDHFSKAYKITLQNKGLYDKINGEDKFEENLGIYYQEEIGNNTDTPDANKNKKRVITYTQI